MQNNQEILDIAQKLISIANTSQVSIRKFGGEVILNQRGTEYRIDAQRPKTNISNQVRFR